MNRRLKYLGAILLAAGAAGCATTALERKAAASDSMVGLRDSMVEARSQIEETLVSLNALMTAPSADLQLAYEEFATNTEQIAAQATMMDAQSVRLRQLSDEWLQSWEQSQAKVKDPELRILSERRRAEALGRIQSIERSLAEARESFEPFVTSLEDVQMVVRNDLTTSGVDAVAETAAVQEADQSGKSVARALASTIVDLRVLTRTMTP